MVEPFIPCSLPPAPFKKAEEKRREFCQLMHKSFKTLFEIVYPKEFEKVFLNKILRIVICIYKYFYHKKCIL